VLYPNASNYAWNSFADPFVLIGKGTVFEGILCGSTPPKGFSTWVPSSRWRLNCAQSLIAADNQVSLDGGFNYFLCSPLPGEMIQFDEHMFSDGLVQPPTRSSFIMRIGIGFVGG